MTPCVQVFGPSVAVPNSNTGVGLAVTEIDGLKLLLERLVPISTVPDLPMSTAAAYAKLLLVCMGFDTEGLKRHWGVLLQSIARSGADGPVDCQQWLSGDQVVTGLGFICVLVEILCTESGGEQLDLMVFHQVV